MSERKRNIERRERTKDTQTERKYRETIHRDNTEIQERETILRTFVKMSIA